MNVFLSHVTEEAPLAAAIQDWIERVFGDDVAVFRSSNTRRDLIAGNRWWHDRIRPALNEAELMVVICSAASIRKFWIAFELGHADRGGITIVPICHTGLSKSDLPAPISDWQALDLLDPTFPVDLMISIGAKLGLAADAIPGFSAAEMSQAIADAHNAIAPTNSGAEVVIFEDVSPPSPRLSWEGLRGEEQMVLEYLGTRPSDGFGHDKTAKSVAKKCGWGSEEKALAFLIALVERNLVYSATNSYAGTIYALTQRGREILFMRGE